MNQRKLSAIGLISVSAFGLPACGVQPGAARGIGVADTMTVGSGTRSVGQAPKATQESSNQSGGNTPVTSGGTSDTPTTNPPTNGDQPTGGDKPAVVDEAKYGVNKDMTCAAYIAKYWKVGAFTFEEYKVKKFLFSATLTMRSTVTAVTGSKVTVHTEFDAPNTKDDQVGDVTFDACTEGHKLAYPDSFTNCNTVTEEGFEDVSAAGANHHALKISVADCSNNEGKTLRTTIWRSNDVPLWGIVKREAEGSFISGEINNRLAPTTTQFSFN